MRIRFKVISLIVVGLCIGLVVWFGFLGRETRASQETPERPLLTKLPPIKNCTEHIKLISAELVDRGSAQVAVLEVENEAYVGVTSISVEQLANRERHATVPSGFTPDQPPQIVISPGEKKTITLGYLGAKTPIRIGGV